jgi:hypothetical protein
LAARLGDTQPAAFFYDWSAMQSLGPLSAGADVGEALSLTRWATLALEPLGQKPAPHHLVLLNALERVARGDCDRLMVLMPPGSAKSTYAILNMLLGTLAAMATSTVSYWVGSSAGSAQKTDMLYRSAPPATPST